MALQIPSAHTFMGTSEPDKRAWYQFYRDMVDSMPQNGSVAPEGSVRANKSCLYVQDTGSGVTLWFNTTGNGSSTGWQVK